MAARAPAPGSSLRHAADVVIHLVVRETHIRYRRSVLGWAWSLAQPLARLAVLAFVFTTVLPLDVPNYTVFLFSGLIAWAWISSGIASATSSVLDRRDLLFNPGVSRMVPPVVSVLTDATDYLAALPVLAVFLLFSTGIPITWLLLPVVFVPALLLILGLGYLLCTANVYVRDVGILVRVLVMLGFYVTPVFYTPDQVPERFRWVVDLNPAASLITLQREVLVDGVVPDVDRIIAAYVVGAIALAIGAGVYRRASRTFVDEL